jgi:hypothetical protein
LSKNLYLILCIAFLTTSCSLRFDQNRGISQSEAREIIQRNIFLGESLFPIDDPRVYQYGNVHVDGPSGGMLYRFQSSHEAYAWIVEKHEMQLFILDEGEHLPLQFLEDTPWWWEPEKSDPAEYYVFQEEFSTGGRRRLLVVFDTNTLDIYIVEHFSDMPGI